MKSLRPPMGPPPPVSDVRLKTNILRIGTAAHCPSSEILRQEAS